MTNDGTSPSAMIVAVHAAATPSRPQDEPIHSVRGKAARMMALSVIGTCGRFAASSTDVLKLCSDPAMTATHSTWTVPAAGSHWSPNSNGTRSGATIARPVSAGNITAARNTDPRSQISAMRAGLSRIRANAA